MPTLEEENKSRIHHDFLDCDDFEALGEWDTRACCKDCHSMGDDGMAILEHTCGEQALVCCFLADKLRRLGH